MKRCHVRMVIGGSHRRFMLPQAGFHLQADQGCPELSLRLGRSRPYIYRHENVPCSRGDGWFSPKIYVARAESWKRLLAKQTIVGGIGKWPGQSEGLPNSPTNCRANIWPAKPIPLLRVCTCSTRFSRIQLFSYVQEINQFIILVVIYVHAVSVYARGGPDGS